MRTVSEVCKDLKERGTKLDLDAIELIEYLSKQLDKTYLLASHIFDDIGSYLYGDFHSELHPMMRVPKEIIEECSKDFNEVIKNL